LYEALCGSTPFDGESQYAIMEQHLNKRPPVLASLGATVPAQVERAIQRALAKRVEERYSDAAAFRAELEAVEAATGSGGAERRSERPIRAPISRRALAAGLGIAVVIGCGVAGYLLVPRNSPAKISPPRAASAVPSWPAPHALTGITFAV